MKIKNTTKWIVGLLIMLPLMAFGGQVYFDSSDVNLGTFSEVKCSTGLTCTQSSGRLNMVSSPTLATALSLKAADSTASSITLQADNSDDNGDDWKIDNSTSDVLSFNNDTSGSQVAKLSIATTGAVTFTNTITGHRAVQVAATATTITSAQCGSTFSNSGAVQMELPEASTVIGCTLTFVTLNASNFDVNPDDGDQILTATNAAGDATRNATVGNSIVLRAVSASQWAEIAVNGTWSDIN